MKSISLPSFRVKTHNGIFSTLRLNLEHKSFTGLLGKNGAGKTTLANSIFENWQTIFGRNSSLNAYYMQQFLSRNLLCQQNISSFDFLLLGNSKIEKREIYQSAEIFEISNVLYSNLYKLSGGEWKRLQLVKAWLSRAEVCILDEPTAGLDLKFCNQFYTTWIARPTKEYQFNLLISHESPFKIANLKHAYQLHDASMVPFFDF
jgi:macrolide transport system ATP-binding/permease protein